jgi:nitrogen fixation protein NifQ
MNGPDRRLGRAIIYAELLQLPRSSRAADDPNRSLLASLLAGLLTGEGCLPADLALGDRVFQHLLGEYFGGCAVPATDRQLEVIPEWGDLQKLLLDHRARIHPSELLLANIVASACAGRDHLWQDLGLANREELSQLMQRNFPALAKANTGDMKWKKFLYRQFCSREGIYVCPAPSCAECKEYAKCFGPEN